MREESHLDDMRSAIRGDFERLAERRGEQELMRVADPEPEPEADADDARDGTTDDAMALEPEPAPEEAPQRRSWLSRFLSP